MSVFNVNYSQTRIAMHPVAIRSAPIQHSYACRSYSTHACSFRQCLRHLGWCIVHRKSRIVNVVEALHKAVDEHCEGRLVQIQKAKERHAYDLKCKACLLLCVVVRPCQCMYGIGCMCVCTHVM